MRIIVAGNRTFKNFDLMASTLDNFIYDKNKANLTIVSGEAVGADELARKYADINGIKRADFEAPWTTMGRSAGPFRNKLMAEYAIKDPDKEAILFAFWDGQSVGTGNMIKTAKKYKIETHIVLWDPEEEVDNGIQ